MDFSLFGRKFTRHAGITQLMDDLNQGLLDPNAIMLGGGNPAAIPAMLQAFEAEAGHQLASGELLKSMINYDGPRRSIEARIWLEYQCQKYRADQW